MEKKLRVGVVGLGHRGRHMFKLAGQWFDCVEPAAACDVLPDNWYKQQWLSDKAMAEYFPDAQFYENYEEMLDKANLDAVIVETGADIHAEFCAMALRKNINVLTDIPVVASLEEADLLWKTEKESSAIISVGANPNEQKFVSLLKDFYKKGLLGNPYYMEAEYIHWSLPGSEERKHLSEHVVDNSKPHWRTLLTPIRYCTHSLGPLLTVLKEDLRTATYFGTGQHADEEYKNDKDDMGCAMFQTDSGVIVKFMKNGRCRAAVQYHNYRVFGTEGYMEKMDRYYKQSIRYNSVKELDTELKEIGGTSKIPAEYENHPNIEKAGHGGVDFILLDRFFKALVNNEPAPISLREGLAMTLPGIYAEQSKKRNGEKVRMYYPWDREWDNYLKTYKKEWK